MRNCGSSARRWKATLGQYLTSLRKYTEDEKVRERKSICPAALIQWFRATRCDVGISPDLHAAWWTSPRFTNEEQRQQSAANGAKAEPYNDLRTGVIVHLHSRTFTYLYRMSMHLLQEHYMNKKINLRTAVVCNINTRGGDDSTMNNRQRNNFSLYAAY